MPLPLAWQRHNVYNLSMRLFFVCYQTCKHNMENYTLILMPVSTNGLWEKGMKQSNLGVKGQVHLSPSIDSETCRWHDS